MNTKKKFLESYRKRRNFIHSPEPKGEKKNGKKIKGRYALVKTDKQQTNRWLLIKMRDAYADARRKPTSSQPKSVLSGKTIQEIKQEKI